MNRSSLCPPTTTITDFAYPPDHPLRLENYPTNKRGSYSSEDNEYSDENADDFGLHDQSSDEINLRAIALFDFEPENANEVALKEGQMIWISYRHGQGWLVAEDPNTGENGLIPEEYVEILYSDEVEDVPKPFMPQIFRSFNEHESEWEDTEDDARSENGDDNGTLTRSLEKQMREATLLEL